MSATSKYSNYSQFQQCNSKLNTMIQFDKSGTAGQIVGSNGATGLVWMTASSGPQGNTGATGPRGEPGPSLPILTTRAPYGSHFLLANGSNVYDNNILTYADGGKNGYITSLSDMEFSQMAGRSVRIEDDQIIVTANNNYSVLTPTALTFNGKSILPTTNTFDFMIDGDSYSIPCVSIGKQYMMTPQSSFVINTTDSPILLNTSVDFSSSFLSAVIYRNNVFYPLQVDLTSSNIISLTGNFDYTQTVYFSGIIFSS